jgi:hypothetical protein
MGLGSFWFAQHLVEGREACFPKSAVALEPVVKLAQRLRSELIEALLGARLDRHQARVVEHPQVLGDLGLPERQAVADLVHAEGAGAQELDDAEAIGLGQGREGGGHGLYILQ